MLPTLPPPNTLVRQFLIAVDVALGELSVARGTCRRFEALHASRMQAVAVALAASLTAALQAELEAAGFVAFEAITAADLRGEPGSSLAQVDALLAEAVALQDLVSGVPPLAAALGLGPDAPRGELAVRWLAHPLKIRFHRHFLAPGSATNRPDKPEWMYAHVAKWLRKHALVAVFRVGAVLAPDAPDGVAALQATFASVVLEWVAFKVNAELEASWASPGFLLAHAISETLAFDESLDALLHTPAAADIHILPCFYAHERRVEAWLALERDAAHAELDALLAGSDVAQARGVIGLTSALLDRLYGVPGCRAFQRGMVELVAHIASRYLRVLVAELRGMIGSSSLAPAQWSRAATVLNSMKTVRDALAAEDDALRALSLAAALADGAAADSLFGSIVDAYALAADSQIDSLAENVEHTFHVYTSGYRHAAADEASLRLAPGLSALRGVLGLVEPVLASPLFETFCATVGVRLARYLLKHVVRKPKKRYTAATGATLAADMRSVVLLVRREFPESRRVGVVFAPLLQTVDLLALPPADLAELRQQAEAVRLLGLPAKARAFLEVNAADAIGSIDDLFRLLELRGDV
ncbi:uncharacterized protein AMSG_06984 [Thecamonas trahens ATCC 50062]|uniref:Uncharacterized protein n=1 Tax=Thecamonas trahens ATCC 50062 TaxID=461836 RepID=A0A0L0DFJ2_THETB|nr:hypothetical protein AMSG_06984 [Thecamonas trahens ATCC 50062]KNC51010.1 hypothetical protein AMSG_06984 [Thecamonas trahens ATCC 50062]|eukprot:XP_013756478.1 hypothetical protein AMSG_06984 [Thecamonas trahens ATCC 50062]